jgi:hypothetical protein
MQTINYFNPTLYHFCVLTQKDVALTVYDKDLELKICSIPKPRQSQSNFQSETAKVIKNRRAIPSFCDATDTSIIDSIETSLKSIKINLDEKATRVM